MALWPSDVQLCNLLIDDGLSSTGIETTTFVTVKLVLQGTSRLVWSDGTEFLPLPDKLRNPDVIPVPVTDQTWRDGGGNTYTGFAYDVTVERYRATASTGYTVRVQPTSTDLTLTISEHFDGSVGEPIIIPTVHVGTTYTIANQSSVAITHGLGRRPLPVFYDTNGAPFDTDYTATTTVFTATFPTPISGSVVLI